MTSSFRHRVSRRVFIVIAVAAMAAALVGSFWPVDNSTGVGCGSVLVSTTEAFDRDDANLQKVITSAPAASGPDGDVYHNNLLSPGEVDAGPMSVLSTKSNVELCENVRSTVRTYLYSATAAALVIAGIGWFWLRRRRRDADNTVDS